VRLARAASICGAALLAAAEIICIAPAARAAEQHTVTLSSAGLWWASREQKTEGWDTDNCDSHERTVDPGTALVGFSQYYDAPGGILGLGSVVCGVDWVYQGKVKFDLDPLRQYEGPVVTRAELSYDQLVLWPPPSIDTIDSCVYTVSRATGDGTENYLFPNENIDRLPLGFGASDRWDVTEEAERWLIYPDDNFGLVLRGRDESFPDEGHDGCVSVVANFRLDVTFVSASPIPTPTPNLAQRTGQAGRAGVVPGLNVQSPAPPPPPGPLPPPAPAPAPADLRVSKLQVASKAAPTCVAGPNQVTLAIQNTGGTDPGVFAVNLEVDGKVVQHTTVGGVGPGSEKTSVFSDVKLDRGTHTLRVLVDPDHAVSPANDENRTRSTQVTCARA
jgi:hypothetical protein